MRGTRLTLALACVALLVAAGPAAAAIVPGQTVDGPRADIPAQTVQTDVAPDGTAALAYLKADHVYVSVLGDGAWGAPVRVDEALPDPSSAPRIAVANGGKVVVTFTNGPTAATQRLYATVKPDAGSVFGLAASIAGPESSYGDVDLAPGGNGYVALESNNRVYARRIEGSTFTPVGLAVRPLNDDPTQDAGQTDGEARVATQPDGSGAVMVWSEGSGGARHVYARRLTGTLAGMSPAQATLFELGGAPAAPPDLIMPDVGIDNAGRAWVVFRQSFTYGGSSFGRALVRPLDPRRGNLGPTQVIDGLGNPPTENVEYPRVDVNAAGQGLSANYLGTSVGVQSAALAGGAWTRGLPVNAVANTGTAFASPAIAENGSGLVSWLHDPDGMGAEVKRVVARTTAGGFGPTLILSDPALGEVQGAQLTSAAGGNAFAAVGYVQGGPGAADPRRVGAAVVDLPPPPVPDNRDTTAPSLSGLRLSRKRFRLRLRLPSAAAVRTGTTIRYRLSEAAAVRVSFTRIRPGRRAGGRCVKPRRGNRRRGRCVRYLAVRTALSFADQGAGARRIRFAGRLTRGRSLKPGPYRLTLRARDAAGLRSAPVSARFKLLPRKRHRR